MLDADIQHFLNANDFEILSEDITTLFQVKYGFTPLGRAAFNGDIEIINRLIYLGCPVDLPNIFTGATPLYDVIEMGHSSEVLECLVMHGANHLLAHSDGETVFALATRLGKWESILAIYEKVKKLANLGDRHNQFIYSLWLMRQYSNDGNVTLAMNYIHNSAEQGYACAAFYLGDLYERGEIVKKNLDKAIRFYEIAAKGGHLIAAEKLPKIKHLCETTEHISKELEPTLLSGDKKKICESVEQILRCDYNDDIKKAVLEFVLWNISSFNDMDPSIIVSVMSLTRKMVGEKLSNEVLHEICAHPLYMYIVNRELLLYVEEAVPFYNSVEFAKIGLESAPEFLDPITNDVMNFPVSLKGLNYDFDTLLKFDAQENGIRKNPFTRSEFTWDEVKPNYSLQRKIKEAIEGAKIVSHDVAMKVCWAVKLGDVQKLKELLAANPKHNVNIVLKNDVNALHLAAMHSKIDCLQVLTNHGGALYTKVTTRFPCPFYTLREKRPEDANTFLSSSLAEIKNKMRSGDSTAYQTYGNLILSGVLDSKSTDEGIYYLEKSGVLGNVDAYMNLIDIFEQGLYGKQPDMYLAQRYCSRAVEELNSTKAKLKLTSINTIKAGEFKINTSIFSENEIVGYANDFDPIALYVLGSDYIYGWRDETNVTLGLRLLKYSADLGCAQAQYIYSIKMMHFSFNIEIINKAAEYMQKAADQGLIVAQLDYANLCANHNSTEGDMRASFYYKLAADQGNVKAQYEYAMTCRSKTTENFNDYIEYTKKAADAGHLEAQYNYGYMCIQGNRLIQRDEEMGIDYIKLAADQGHQKATDAMKMIISADTGKITVDLKAANEILTAYAERGDPASIALLEKMPPFIEGDVQKTLVFERSEVNEERPASKEPEVNLNQRGKLVIRRGFLL